MGPVSDKSQGSRTPLENYLTRPFNMSLRCEVCSFCLVKHVGLLLCCYCVLLVVTVCVSFNDINGSLVVDCWRTVATEILMLVDQTFPIQTNASQLYRVIQEYLVVCILLTSEILHWLHDWAAKVLCYSYFTERTDYKMYLFRVYQIS